MKINFIEKLLGSGFYTGYIPKYSGTFGSLAGLIIYFIPGFEKPFILIPSIILFTFSGVYIGTKFEKIYGEDPAECTIDEIVGMWISLLFVPKEIIFSLITFLIWRFFDITKPYPIRKLENLPGGFGIMLDDVAAGIYSAVLVRLILIIFVHS